MTCLERVILTFAGIGKAAQATHLAIGRETIATACENLVSVSLMPHVPHQPVVGRVEHIV